MDGSQKLKKQVKEEFMEYLTLHKHRKTPERFAILDHIYSIKGHFDMDSLYKSMIEVNFRVSRATLYNTIQLLHDCGLVVKHQFGGNISKYERAYGNENHNHLICTTCGEVREMKNEDLLTSAQLKKIRKFTVSYYSMYIYGTCSKCTHAKRMKLRRLARTNISGRAKKSSTGGRTPKSSTGGRTPKSSTGGGTPKSSTGGGTPKSSTGGRAKKSSPVKLAKKSSGKNNGADKTGGDSLNEK